MRRIAALALVVLAGGGSASAGGPPPVLAVEWHARGNASLLWVDPLTLRPVPGGRLVTGEAAWPAARSPLGRFLLTTSATSSATTFRVVDLSSKRASPVLRIHGATGAHAAWSRSDRAVAVTFANGKAVEALALAPSPLRVVRRTPLAGALVAARASGGRLVVLLGPRDEIGPLRLVLVAGDGSVRTVALDGFRGGFASRREGDDYVFEQASPALAVHPSGRRAVVISPERYADVDLRALTGTTRAFQERRTQKRGEGWWRTAVWAGADRVAFTGSNYTETSPAPAGLRLLDLSSGDVRVLDSTSSAVALMGRTLLGSGRSVSAYGLDGGRRYGIESTSEVMVGPSYLYLNDSRDRTAFRVVDPADGRVLRRAETARPLWIVHGL